jgi:hypothetical protein
VGVLAPAGLLLGLAVAVPILLHLLHRTERDRISFPALQYLLRMERDHARQIRMRQWLLLALRIALLLLLALAAARAVLRSGGAAHPPTAVVLVLDNSMSSGRVVGTGRVLDTLRTRALETLRLAGDGDRFWVIRAGSSWEPVSPLSAAAAEERVRGTEVVDTWADLGVTVSRAREILARSGAPRGEVHLLSDLQASAFPAENAPDTGAAWPVLAWTGSVATEPNGFVASAVVGGGLAPRAGRRTDVAIVLGGDLEREDERGIRLLVDGRLEGAVRTRPGGSVVLPVGPFAAGPLEAEVEIDPDALSADDRFFLRTVVVPPPAVARVGDAGDFLASALDLLEEEGRILPSGVGSADVIVASGGEMPASLAPGQDLVVIPAADAARRAALGRQLTGLGAPIAVGPVREGESRVATDATGAGLEGVVVRGSGRVVPAPGARSWVTLDDGTVWAASGPTVQGSEVTVLASPLVPEHTDVPLSAGMIPLVEWLVGRSGGGPRAAGQAGDTLRVSARATEVESPTGTRIPVDGTLEVRATAHVGIWSVLAGDTVLERLALNAPPRESTLEPLDPADLRDRLGPPVETARTAARWGSSIYVERQGRELWRMLVILALVLLLAESWVGASGGTEPRRTSVPTEQPRARPSAPPTA